MAEAQVQLGIKTLDTEQRSRFLEQHDQIPPADGGILIQPNNSYESYLQMQKVWLDANGAEDLYRIHDSLKDEVMPRYLSAAGWAAAEAAIVGAWPTSERLQLLRQGIVCWEKAIQTQLAFNKTEKAHLIEHSAPYRIALDLAVIPLLEGLILGHVTEEMCRNAYVDCLEVARANAEQLEHAKADMDVERYADHVGFAHECNALLALNRVQSKDWFALPTIARADSGYYHPEQTHDLLVVRRRAGEVQSVVPVEVKAKASLRDRKRYLALIVRGKMHLCDNKHDPLDTFYAIAAVEAGTASTKQITVAHEVSQRFMNMIKDYYSGQELGGIATTATITRFHDRSVVAERHPGLSITA
jgi:hypothetical protein